MSPGTSTPSSARVFVVRAGPWLDRAAAASRPGAARLEQLVDLAHALAASPAWSTLARATLVVRPGPPPLLGVVGHLDAAEEATVESLRELLLSPHDWVRYVDYDQAERDCGALADRLVDRFGRQELSDFRFEALPRGGHIVLGMLSYVLGLGHRQLDAQVADDGRTVVLVDDCALSGVRFRDVLRHHPAREIVLAPLYAAAPLRAAVEAVEPRVLACVSGRDLRDLAPQRLGAQYPAWRDRWTARQRGEYWIGDPEHVCFSWNEPDIVLWNPVTDQAEDAWRVIPPERCLKNRTWPVSSPPRLTVLPVTPGALRPADDVVWAELEGQVVVAAASGDSVLLGGVAADMWRRLVETGDRTQAWSALTGEYDVDPARLRADLAAFIDGLASRGLLTGPSASGGAPGSRG